VSPRHVARPAALLAQTLRARLRDLAAQPVEVACDGAASDRHRLLLDARTATYEALDHDEAAEAVLRAVGGTEPRCTRIVAATAQATSGDLWAALRFAGVTADDPLASLPDEHLRALLARALEEDFAGASTVVRDSVAKLGLALLGDPPPATDDLLVKFQMTRELPHWDPGPGPWSDQELVLLNRCMRAAPGDARPHLAHVPRNPVARHAVATYVAALLDPARALTDDDLRRALSTTHRNVKALTALLVEERLLERRDGRYRLRSR
jgi:hypothetical protein